MEKHGILSRHIILCDSSTPIYGIILIQGEVIQDIIQLEPSFPTEQVQLKFSQWKITDYSDYYISPGIIDLNVRREWDTYESLTKSAISGGTTFILEQPSFYNTSNSPEELYCDVGSVHVLNDSNLDSVPEGTLALKAFIFQPSHNIEALTNLRKALDLSIETHLPLFIDPNLPDPRMLYMASPLRLEKNEEHKEKEVSTLNCYAAAFAQGNESEDNSEENEESVSYGVEPSTLSLRDSDIDCLKTFNEKVIREAAGLRLSDISTLIPNRDDSLKLESLKSEIVILELIKSDTLKSDSSSKSLKTHKKKSSKTIYDDLDKRVAGNSKNIEVLCMAEKNTYQFSGSTQFSANPSGQKPLTPRQRPPTLALNTGSKVQAKTDYTFYLANCPESWETEGVDYILSKIPSNCKIHVQGVSSAAALNKIRQKSETFKQLTCEIPASHLFFNNSNISPHDTRFKSTPPIRNTSNFNLLWDLLKMRGIPCISSQHSYIEKSHKAVESRSFQNALNGLCSLGFSLQAVWSTINIPISKVEQLEHYLVRLSKWLSLSPAKVLDLATRGSIGKGKLADLVVWTPYCRSVAKGNEFYEDLAIFDGKEVFGAVHKVYLRGQVAYDEGSYVKVGKRVARK